MNVFNFLVNNRSFNYLKEGLINNLSPLQKKVALIAALVFSCLSVGCFISRCCFTARKEIPTKTTAKAKESLPKSKGKSAFKHPDSIIRKVKKETEEVEKTIVFNKELITHRLRKNLQCAQDQQNKESEDLSKKKRKPFVVDVEKSIEVNTIEGELKTVNDRRVGIVACQGGRPQMEDAHFADKITFTVKGTEYVADLYGVFDGHGGSGASKFTAANISQYLTMALEENNPEELTEEGIWKALRICFQQLDANYGLEGKNSDGTTATVALILGNKIWVANAGDARTILSHHGQAKQLSEDGIPLDPKYRKTVERLGGYVSPYNNRVNGVLAVTRAIGDKTVVGKTNECCVSPDPKIICYSLEEMEGGKKEDSFLILACDGLYDVASTNEIIFAINQMAKAGQTTEEMAKRLVETALFNGAGDNISVIVVKL